MKNSLDELIAAFQAARTQLSEQQGLVVDARKRVEVARVALTAVERDLEADEMKLRNARSALRTAGERLKDALPGYIAGVALSLIHI